MFRSFSPLFLCTALVASAQTSAGTTLVQDNPDAPESKHVSLHVTKLLMEKLPAYATVAVTKPEPKAETAMDAVVLEKRVVYGAKSRTFTEQELASSAGMAALLRKQFSVSSLPLNNLMPDYAKLMQSDNVRLARMAEFGTTVENLRRVGDSKASKELQEEVSRAFIRGHDWRTESLDRSSNNNRR